MASRDKKVSLGRKPSASPVPPREVSTSESSAKSAINKPETYQADEAPKLAQIKARNIASKSTTAIAKKLKKNATQKVIKKNITLKAKEKTKFNQKLSKKLLNTAKSNLEVKKALLKNGVKRKIIRKRKVQQQSEDLDDSPPVLEPIYPINENAKQPKKRLKKAVEEKKIKVENPEGYCSITATIESIIKQLNTDDTKPVKRAKVGRKPKVKVESVRNHVDETIEQVMSDLSSLIEVEDLKKESDNLSEEIKVETKPKKGTVKNTKLDLLKKLKKENIENKFESDSKVIDMLDLNVAKKKNKIVHNRRHSIEKCPVEYDENIQSLSVFSNIPRNLSPKSKRSSKMRQSIDLMSSKRASPYSTRSDSPARILRNGKHRKLRDMNLLDGLDSEYKKRRRLCSDYSGSEISISKSGYESDSSFSDLASLHGAENSDTFETSLKSDIKKDLLDSLVNQNQENINIKSLSSRITNILKRSLSTDTSNSGVPDIEQKISEQNFDTNSNLCDTDIKLEMSSAVDIKDNQNKLPCASIKSEEDEDEYPQTSVSPSMKVPEKSIILDIMKQTFNVNAAEDQQEKERRTTRSSAKKPTHTDEKDLSFSAIKFYGVSDVPDDMPVLRNETEEIDIDEFKEMIPLEQEIDAFDLTEFKEVGKSKELITPSTLFASNEIYAPQELFPSSEISTPKELIVAKDIIPIKEIAETESTFDLNDSIDSNEIIDPKVITDCKADAEQTKDDAVNKLDTNDELMINVDSIEQVEKLHNFEPTAMDTKELESEEEKVDEKRSEEDLSENSSKKVADFVETPESLAVKESILQALGLQSLKAAEEARLKSKERLVPKQDSYTGMLKTVIKLNRYDKKRGKNSLKMTLQKSKKGTKDSDNNDIVKTDEEGYKVTKEGGSSAWKSHGGQSSDTAGALRKSHYANRSNMDGSSEHTSDGDSAPTEEGPGQLLVIPEKASSFSIHPGRLCKDECAYCFGKFGLFDTPCHIAQMKSVERQNKILSTERHLNRDSCLCDACYRHVDRKSNTPSYSNNKSYKRNNLVAPVPRQNHCHVLGCKNVSTNILRRKWIIKMRKNVCKVINIDLDNPGLHSIPICEEHYAAVEHLMVCAMCKRRLARNHIHYLGPESNDLNSALNEVGIPVKLHDKPVVCKLCKYFATILLKNEEDRPENSAEFYKEYMKRLLHFHDVEHMDDAEAEEPIPVPSKDKCDKEQIKKKKKSPKPETNNEPPVLEPQVDIEPPNDQNRVPSTESHSTESRSESPSDYMVDYQNLIPNIALECGSDDADNSKKEVHKKPIVLKKILRPETVKEAVEISKNIKIKTKSDIAVQRLGSNPSISVRQLFPGEEDLPLQGSIEFHNVKERTPEGWEKCTTTVQYDNDTKQLWNELQKPYGNQSSFLRHLILLEKYFRNGDLVLSPNASHHSVNYSESVQNRLRAYDNIPSATVPTHSPMLPLNKPQKSVSGIVTSKEGLSQNVTIVNAANIPKNTPITISQFNNPSFLVSTTNKQKTPGLPPGLMPLHPGTNRPVAPLVKVPQSQKIKFPITKNWRPNLIPIDTTKKIEKKSGLVQVISGGKPYHITIEDYKKMCAIKRTFDLKQKKLQEMQRAKLESQKMLSSPPSGSLLKSIAPRKGLIISKTSTVTSPKSEFPPAEIEKEESSLEKLDKQVEKLEAKLNDSKSVMILPKIPKSLTVIPQTITRKLSRPSSPALLITPKPKPVTKS